MLDCSKNSYPSQWAAERALQAIQEAAPSPDRKIPTGSYWCSLCRAWHLTSKSKSQTAPWLKATRTRGLQG